jgi:hypothetical protein
LYGPLVDITVSLGFKPTVWHAISHQRRDIGETAKPEPEEVTLLDDVEQQAILIMLDGTTLDVKAMTETLLMEDDVQRRSE